MEQHTINCINKKTNIMKTLKDFALALALWLAFFTGSLILLNII